MLFALSSGIIQLCVFTAAGGNIKFCTGSGCRSVWAGAAQTFRQRERHGFRSGVSGISQSGHSVGAGPALLNTQVANDLFIPSFELMRKNIASGIISSQKF